MYNGKRICATIEARMTSNRLPGKVLMEYCEKSNLQHIVERLKWSKYIDEVVVATTTNITDEPIVDMCNNINCKVFRGSEEDVLLRVLDAAKCVDAEVIVEITGDCPVVDWNHVDQLIEYYFSGSYDYVSNIINRTFPRGFDVQVFPLSVLERVNKLTQSPVDHEHVSLFIYTHPEMFSLGNIEAPENLNFPNLGITLDNKDDYELIKVIYEKLYTKNVKFTAEEVVQLLVNDKVLFEKAQDRHRKNPFQEQKQWVENNE